MSYCMHVLKRKQPFKVENGFFCVCFLCSLFRPMSSETPLKGDSRSPWISVRVPWALSLECVLFLESMGVVWPVPRAILSHPVARHPCWHHFHIWWLSPFFFSLSPNLWKEVVLTVALARFLLSSSYVMALCEEISVTKSEEPTAIGDSVRHW